MRKKVLLDQKCKFCGNQIWQYPKQGKKKVGKKRVLIATCLMLNCKNVFREVELEEVDND